MKNLFKTILFFIPLSILAQGNTLLFDYSTSYIHPNKNVYNSKLFVNKSKSTFYWNDQTEESTQMEGLNLKITSLDTIGTINQFHFSSNELNSCFFFGKRIFIKEKIPEFKWSISSEKKEILGYLCYKAKVSFRGREYIAWFTNEIPISVGPWKFSGLPGVILEIKDVSNIIEFTCVKISYSEDTNELNTENLFDTNEFIGIEEYITFVDGEMKKIENTIKSKLPRGTRLNSFSFKNNQLETQLSNN